MKKASVIGHFGLGLNCLDGQTVKTKIVTDELIHRYGEEEIQKYDTHGSKIKLLIVAPFQIIKALLCSRNVIILPAHNGLRINAPLLSFFRCFFCKRRIHYVVIGGWLPEYLTDKCGLTKSLKHFDGIYVETFAMKCALEDKGFTNVLIMPNCKNLRILSKDQLVYPNGEPYKLCTFSRVSKQKGIEDAVEVIQSVNKRLGKTAYSLTIYGQVDRDQLEWFEELKSTFPDYVQYGGLVNFDKSTEVLSQYFALLFPTYYSGEGFAGTLIDALAAGIPVIASDWRYNAEIVKDKQTGLLYPAKDNMAFETALIWAYNNQDVWREMKLTSIEVALNYLPSKAMIPLLTNL